MGTRVRYPAQRQTPPGPYEAFITLLRLCIAGTGETTLNEGRCLGGGRQVLPAAVQPWHLLWVPRSITPLPEEILALAEVPSSLLPIYIFFIFLETGCISSELPLPNTETRPY